MRKPHPCGASEWEILRVGADFRLKCTGCGHQVMLPRREVEKFVKEVTKKLNHDLNGATRGIMLHY
ncbi:MAG: DUF951 domain-containing protein [Clostridiales bacterium]|nr:DUF951 domain-containing protein [Clostridiales bacterium]